MGTRILVVDDEDTLRSVISRVLQQDGHDVTQASCAEHALKLFRAEPFPLVITDIVMGQMSGLELLAEIQQIEPSTLTVVMTSHASLDTATGAIRAGAYDYLIKPFDELDLISAVVSRAAEKIEMLSENEKLMDRLTSYAEELEDVNAKLRTMAHRDGLTGLYNHRYFRQALETELSRSRRHGHSFALLFIDIDHFKNYNDSHGHLAGDDVLRDLGRLIENCCRDSTVAARYGGEEFVLLVPEIEMQDALRFAERLRAAAEEYPFKGQETQPKGRLTLCIGVSTFPADAADGPTLVNLADRALYKAKRGGRNLVEAWDKETIEAFEHS